MAYFPKQHFMGEVAILAEDIYDKMVKDYGPQSSIIARECLWAKNQEGHVCINIAFKFQHSDRERRFPEGSKP